MTDMVAGLAGAFDLHPGQTPSILGRRPVLQAGLLAKLLQGVKTDAIAERLGLLFNLCGHAHRLAATLLLEQVTGTASVIASSIDEKETVRAQYLHWQTVREHMQRMALDWPMQFGALLEQGLVPTLPWPQAPLWKNTNKEATASAAQMSALQDWLIAQKMVDGKGQATGQWADYLQALRQSLGSLLPSAQIRPLRLEHIQEVAQDLEDHADFAFCPQIQGLAHETGAWARLDSAGVVEMDAGTRLQSRWDEVQALLAGHKSLRFGHGRTQNGFFSYVEMSRGLLLHWLRWDVQQQRVDDYRVLAPTEWNFHPQGQLAQALESWDDTDCRQDGQSASSAQKVLGMAYSLDPCVAVRLAQDADATVTKTEKELPYA